MSVWWNSHSRYVITDVPPVQTTADVKPTNTSSIATPAAPTSATPATTTRSACDSSDACCFNGHPTYKSPITKNAGTTTIAAAPTTLTTTTKPAKKPALSTMRMALPEPDIDTDHNENNND